MGLIHIKQAIRQLSLKQLRRLDEWVQELIREAEEAEGVESITSRQVIVEERTIENKTYRQEGVRCGKEKCKCAAGKLHGPYWYSYTRAGGKVKSQYVGKKLPTSKD